MSERGFGKGKSQEKKAGRKERKKGSRQETLQFQVKGEEDLLQGQQVQRVDGQDINQIDEEQGKRIRGDAGMQEPDSKTHPEIVILLNSLDC